MEYDKNSFLSGLSVGRALRGAGGGGGGFGIATETEIGGIKAKPKTDADTTEVHIDSNGFLWCAGGGGGGGSNPPQPPEPGTSGRPELDRYFTGTYGAMWTYSGSDTGCVRLTRDNDPHRLVGNDAIEDPVPQKNGEGGSSPFDSILPWAGMEVYNVRYNGNYIKKGEDGFAMSGRDVNVMVWIPPFYYRVIDDSDLHQICYYVSSEPHDEDGFQLHPGSGRYVGRYTTGLAYDICTSQTGLQPLVNRTRAKSREEAVNLGEKWYQYDTATWSAIGILYLVEYANLDSQTAVGQGYVSGSSAQKNGTTDEMTYHTGWPAGTDGKTGMQYRNIENVWGNLDQWCDGFASGKVCTDPTKYADTADESYAARTIAAAMWACIPNLGPHSFSSDSSSISSSDAVLYVGGYYDSGSDAGMWRADSYSASGSAGPGSRLLYIP